MTVKVIACVNWLITVTGFVELRAKSSYFFPMALFLLLFLSFATPLFSQVSKDLASSQPYLIDAMALKSNSFLFIQEDCEACEKSLQQLEGCAKDIRSKMNLVVLESESWAQKKVKSPEVQKIQFANHYFMTREEAQKIKVRGTPTYLIGSISELKPLSCRVIGGLQKQLNRKL